MRARSNDTRWFMTADGHVARLFKLSRSPGGSLHVDQVAEVLNTHADDRELGRPSSLGGQQRAGSPIRSVGSAAPHHASFGHGSEETDRRYARDLHRFTDAQRAAHGIDGLHVFVPPRFLGVVRQVWGDAKGIELHQAELTGMAPSVLAGHPKIAALAGAGS